MATGAAAGALLTLAACGPASTEGPVVEPAPSSAPSSAPAEPRFAPSATGEQDCDGRPCTSLVFGGDFLLHDGLWDTARADARRTGAGTHGLDFAPMLAAQRAYLDRSDLAICQMETPVASPRGPFQGYPTFNVPPQVLPAAKDVGYDACTTASNHSIDRGTEGLERTRRAVTDAGLGVTGTNLTEEQSRAPAIFTTGNGVRVAVITGTYGLNGLSPTHPWQVDRLDPQQMIDKARRAHEQGADIVIANMHAGEEYASRPNEEQTRVAHALVDSGQFQLVYGEHTHSVLPIERYKDTWIAYGLGNNLTELSQKHRVNNEGMLLNAVLTRDGDDWTVTSLRWAPSLMVSGPYRWCPVAATNPSPDCAPIPAAKSTRDRTAATVNKLGADAHGATEWELGAGGSGAARAH